MNVSRAISWLHFLNIHTGVVQEETDIPTISVAARFRYSEVRSAEIEYSAGGGKFLHVCAHASSKAPSRQPLPIRTMPRPAPDNSGQTERVRPVPAPLAPSLARPSRSAPAQTYLTLHNTNCRSNKSPQSLFHCAAAAYESLIMRRYEKPRAAGSHIADV